MGDLSPAAQTLKHMAEQHQHKNAMGANNNTGMNYMRNTFAQTHMPNGRDTYREFNQFANQDCLQQQPSFHKAPQQVLSFQNQELLKQNQHQNRMYQKAPNEFDMKRMQQQTQYNKQSQQQVPPPQYPVYRTANDFEQMQQNHNVGNFMTNQNARQQQMPNPNMEINRVNGVVNPLDQINLQMKQSQQIYFNQQHGPPGGNGGHGMVNECKY